MMMMIMMSNIMKCWCWWWIYDSKQKRPALHTSERTIVPRCGASSGGERLCPGICRVVGGTGHPRTTSSLPQFLSLSGPYSRDEEGWQQCEGCHQGESSQSLPRGGGGLTRATMFLFSKIKMILNLGWVADEEKHLRTLSAVSCSHELSASGPTKTCLREQGQ